MAGKSGNSEATSSSKVSGNNQKGRRIEGGKEFLTLILSNILTSAIGRTKKEKERGSLTGELKSQYLVVNVQAKLRMAGLDDYDVLPVGGRLMLIRPPKEVNVANMESGLVGKLARWFDSVRAWSKSDIGRGRIVWIRCIDATTKAQTRRDVVRFAVLTLVLHHISLAVRLTVDEDEFPIFIAEEGMGICEKAGSIVYAGTGSLEDSFKACFPSLASLSMVSELVGDDLAVGKLPTVASPPESNTEVQNPLLVINDSMDDVREEPLCNDGLESGKSEWHWRFRDDRDKMDGGGASIIKGAKVDNSRLDMDPSDNSNPTSIQGYQ
ncbi:hypothetical protein Ancab_025652, partial [Ancistrocladus abbreviatus]